MPAGIDGHLLADSIPHGVWVLSATATVEYANRHALEQAGPDCTDWNSLVHADDREAVARDWAIANRTAGPHEWECLLRRADGSFRRHAVRLVPVPGADGRWIATATDISHRETPAPPRQRDAGGPDGAGAEEARDFRSVVMDDMAEGLYTVDGAGLLTTLNRAGAEMLGWDEQDLLGTSIHAAVHAPPPAGTPAAEHDCPLHENHPAGRSGQTIDDTFVRKDGSTFQVACSVAPLAGGTATAGVVVTFRDMTEVRRAELEARHDQKLESLGRLSAGLAHEINTPIQFVGDNTRFLAGAYEDMLELLLVYRECMTPTLGELAWTERTQRAQAAEAKADVEYLAAEIPAAVSQSLEGVERVASLVRAMKSFSYKDSTEQTYADLNEAIRTTLTVARNEVKYVADVALDLGELPDVLCHRGDLNQVFLNLLVNAADALEGKGERGEIRISSAAVGPTAVIRFADNGSGIPEHIRQSIFDPFFTTKGVGKGTGQGLALARAVLDKHGGSIEVQSVVGEGTEFILRLPIDGKQGAPA